MQTVIVALLLILCITLLVSLYQPREHEQWEPLLFVPTITGGSECQTVENIRPTQDIITACGAKPFCQWDYQTNKCQHLPSMYPGYKPII